MRSLVFALAIAVVTTSCAAVQERAGDFDIDLDSMLDEVRDCDRLVDRMVDAISAAAAAADELAAANDGIVPATRIGEIVERVAVSRWFDLAETLGCLRLEMQLQVLDELRDVAPESPAGRDLLERIETELAG